jgi:DNA-binding MarR family transcriptional regulator/energy-coupling factor transporter ATP-binding protein EcfA2
VLYEITPRVGTETRLPANIFGYQFTLCIVSDGEKLHVYIDTPISQETLQQFFGVKKTSYEDLLKIFGGKVFASEARLRRSYDFWFTDFAVADIPGLVNGLASSGVRGGICIAVSKDPGLHYLLSSKASKLMQQALKSGNQAYKIQARELMNRATKLFIGKVLVLAGDKQNRKSIERLVESACTAPVRWLRDSVRDAEALEKKLKPNRIGFLDRLFGFAKDYPLFSEETLRQTIVMPDPSLHKIGFVRGYPLPLLIPQRSGEASFRIGVLEDGREFRLSVEDLHRHAYVIGQTGSGKTTFLKLLVHRLKEVGKAAIVVIDPHGDMAKELAEEMPEALYLHPIRSPFGLNPLDLPRHENRDFAVTIAIDILIEMFKEILKLMETAVNVKYLLQVLLRAFYSKTDSPTLAMLYNAILGLYNGELDLDVDDEEWQRQLEALQNMQDQTFISALSRLEPYAHDKLLLKITSRTTLDFEKIMKPGSITIFAVPKADLGEGLARLVASTIVMKLWFEVLARARMNKPRIPVFLVIDEFQFVADLPIIDTILSEARKYGLHLVIAHQHTKQIPDTLLQSVMSNCAVKVAFQVGGADIKRLAVMDASFADSLAKALTGLTIGKAVVKITARPGEQQPPPVVVQLDYIPHRVYRENIYTTLFDPGEPLVQNLKTMLNPILKYIEGPAKPLEFLLLYYVYRCSRKEGNAALTDLATRLGVRRNAVEEAVGRLASQGFVELYREGNKKMVRYVKGLFNGLRKAAPSEEGYHLARKVLLNYAKKGYVVLPVKQSSGLSARPDLIAVPVDASTWRPIYSKAVAIEIESCNEVEVHPDQVAHNWVKESVRDFAEVHAWTWDRCFNRLREIYEKAGIDRGKVKIFSVKCIEAREKSGKKRETEIKRGASKQVPETGLGNAQSLQVVASATVIREEEEGAAEEEKQEIVRKFKASDGYEYIVVLSDSEAKKFDKFCTGKRIVIKVEGSAIKCVDRATGASAALSPSSLSRAS